MKQDKNTIGGSRRSFMKKSVIAAVAASNMTIFTGLVNAAAASTYVTSDCEMILKEYTDPVSGLQQVKCFFPQGNGDCTGYCWHQDSASGYWSILSVPCLYYDSITQYAICDSLSTDMLSTPS